MAPDLSLPTHAPELGQYGAYNWDDAAFAVYTLINNKIPLSDAAHALEEQWLQQGNKTHLVRPAEPAPGFTTLRDVVQAHIALDKVKNKTREDGTGGAAAAGDLEWWPTAFIVVVREDWRMTPGGGLLFVFADDEKGCEMDRFFFGVEDAYMMLSSLSFGDEGLVRSKEIYGRKPRG